MPACSGGDVCSLVWWGQREATGEVWVDGSPHPIGHGGHARGDGASSVLHTSEAASRFAPVEVWEQRNPWLVERVALAADSGGAGTSRGGLGVDFSFRMLEDCYLTSALERTLTEPWGLEGGGPGRPNGLTVTYPDGRRQTLGKVTRLALPKGSLVELTTAEAVATGRRPSATRPRSRPTSARGTSAKAAPRSEYGHTP